MEPLSSLSHMAGAYKSLAFSSTELPRPSDAEAVARVMSVSVKSDANVAESVQPTREAIAEAAQQIQHFVSSMQRQFSFSKDETTGYIRVSVVDPQSGEVIRTLPSEEFIRIARTFEQLGSLLVNQKA